MLDIKFIRENPQLVQAACQHKNFHHVDIQALLQLDDQLKPLQQQLEQAQAQRNALSKQIPQTPPADQPALKQQVQQLKPLIENLHQQIQELKPRLQNLLLQVPQPARADVPIGKSADDNVEVKTWGTPRKFDFELQDHITLGQKLGLIDIERGVKLAGSRSYLLTGDGARLEQAVLRFAYDTIVSRGYKPVSVPVLVNEAAMEGTGYFPTGRDQAYCIEKDQLALVGTAEVALAGMHADETLELAQLPLRYVAQSSCFRREAGTYGKDARGLYRVHQFQKIEMVVIAPADTELSAVLHDELLTNAEVLLQALGLPYRAVYVCTGDLGQGQVRKHDLETWMPSRQAYGETHSCSTFYDFQARRLNLRYRDPADNSRKLAYTLNNTALASPRILLPLLEYYQQADGSILIPECLRPYMQNQIHIR